MNRAGDVYASVIDELLVQEHKRKASLEQRALAVITSSGVLVTFLFGFAALLRTQQQTALPAATRYLLAAALGCFLTAALSSLRVNGPVNHQPLGVKKDLRKMVTDELWNDDEVVAKRAIAEFRVGEIDRWRDGNGRKARQLQRASTAEAVGVLLVAAAVVLLMFLRSAPSSP